MFKEIRNKITLWNALTLIAFLILFVSLLCLVIQWSLASSGETYLKEVAQSLESGTVQTDTGILSTSVHDSFGYEYIEWTGQSIQSQQISSQQMIEEGYALLQETSEDQTDEEGSFSQRSIAGEDYRIYQTQFDDKGKTVTIQVFQDISAERSVITYVITYLFLIGLAGLFVLVPLAYFLAGKALKPIRENYELQKTFIADASHELRTPLTVIQTNVEVLRMKEHQTIAENEKWIGAIEDECETMSSLITELLTNAQTENRRGERSMKRICVSKICDEAVERMKPVARDHDIRLNSIVEPEIYYRGDEAKLKQLLRIFLDNALKYTPAGGRVILSLSQTKRNVVIKVSDNGLGIAKEDQKKIFSRFYRVDDARSRTTGGTGLGLNIADSIVSNAGGKIHLDSELGEGSCFTVYLPKFVPVK